MDLVKFGLLVAFFYGIFLTTPEVVDPPYREPTPNFPVINEISPYPLPGNAPWLEIHNQSSSENATLNNLCLDVPGSTSYCFDSSEPPIEPGGFRVVCFSGGGNDADAFQCPATPPLVKTVVGPASTVQSWDSSGGQIAMVRTPEDPGDAKYLVDFVAWGHPATEVPDGVALPLEKLAARWVLLSASYGVYDPSTVLEPGNVIALEPGGHRGVSTDWYVAPPEDQTCGETNRGTGGMIISPPKNVNIKIDDATIVWFKASGSDAYCIEFVPIDEETDEVKGPVVQVDVTSPYFVPASSPSISPGKYKYRILDPPCTGIQSPSLHGHRTITLTDIVIDSASVVSIPNIRYTFQRKDTRLLCLEPANVELSSYEGSGCEQTYWDKPHQPQVPPGPGFAGFGPALTVASGWNHHGSNYCVRAAISMIVSAYDPPGYSGPPLSQDRISFEYSNASALSPDYDLQHECTMPCATSSGGVCTGLLAWAVQSSVYQPNMSQYDAAAVGIDYQKEVTFEHISEALDAGRPLMSRWTKNADHMRVIDAYFIPSTGPHTGEKWIRVLDPLAGGPQWRRFDNEDVDWEERLEGLWKCPPIGSAVNHRHDEPEVWLDSDGDGIVDFDEIRRFQTDHESDDSDGDGVPDKVEILSYVFYFPDVLIPTPDGATVADIDAQGDRKEVDEDNDDDGCSDGFEDTDKNGITTASDNSNCFEPGDCEDPRDPGSCSCNGNVG